ncbi:cupin domain-containing protein [Tautonia sociabilis]|uniref:Cupin domain-containing protein n=1 Tax=Tautonia sociabilis TaxID=2080755 RepID=A0A432MJW4_9BACT|nr:hypothetical protein [Tautonia sociabilis]RUL87475.1 hypothetical protein TsocGM_12410 [Tautonia sociabilis]
MRHEETIDAELIRVEAGDCSGPRRSELGPVVLVVVEGSGSALAGDVWVPVKAGDRLTVDSGEPCALRSTGGTVIAVLLRPAAEAAQAA